jgi:nicotinamidase-related amidase
MVSQLIPEASDYIVLKPKHSAFYATPLDTLLSYLKVKTVILAGLITNACILSTAGELYVRDLDVYVPSDCVAAPIKRVHRHALELMKISFDVDTTSSTKLDLRKILKAARG